ncbi:MAG: hypothetical protein Q9170_003926 [Blastenia crenularia]
MISEIAVFEASAPNVDLTDPSSQYKAAIENHLRAVLTANGAKAVYYAQSIEKPHFIITIVNWDTPESNTKFIESPGYSAHISSFRTDLLKEGSLAAVFHVAFPEDPSPALEAKHGSHIGVTEIVFAYFRPSPLPPDLKAKNMDSFKQMKPVAERNGALTKFNPAWATEDGILAPLTGGEEDGGKEGSTVYVNLIGWDEVESHMRFMETEDFKENSHWLTDVEGMKGFELLHAKFFRGGGTANR